MCRALCLLPLLLALSAAGCMRNGPAATVGSERGIFTAEPHSERGILTAQPHSERGILTARPDIELKAAGPRAYVMRYRAPVIGGPYAAIDATVAVPVAAPTREVAYTLDLATSCASSCSARKALPAPTWSTPAGTSACRWSAPCRRADAPRSALQGDRRQAQARLCARPARDGRGRSLPAVLHPGRGDHARPVRLRARHDGGDGDRDCRRLCAARRQAHRRGHAPANKFEVPLNYPLRPGDTIMVKERWF